MTLPANIRVNTSAPWPAAVKASVPITISRQNGIWAVGFSIANLGVLQPGFDPAATFFLTYNSVTKTFSQLSAAQLLASGGTATTISAANSPYTPLLTDGFLDVDTSAGPVEIDLTASASRKGAALSIKDVTGHAAANNITVKPVGGGFPETLDGYTNAAPLVIDSNYGGVTLLPRTLKYLIRP